MTNDTTNSSIDTTNHNVVAVKKFEGLSLEPPTKDIIQIGVTTDDEDGDAITKEEEWIKKKKTELVTTRQIETRVKRQVVLEDGKVVEDTGPMVSTNTTEDTDKKECETTERRNLDEPDEVDGPRAIENIPVDRLPIIDNLSPNHSTTISKRVAPRPDGLVRETKEKKVVSREEIDERLEIEDVQHYGDISDEHKVISCVPSCNRVNPFCACDMNSSIRYLKCPKINDTLTQKYTHYLQVIDEYQIEIDCVAFYPLNNLPPLSLQQSKTTRIIFKNCFGNDTKHANYQFRLAYFMKNTLDVDNWSFIAIIFQELGKVNETLFFENWTQPFIKHSVILENIYFETAAYLIYIQKTEIVHLINTNLIDFDKIGPNQATKSFEITNTKMVVNVNYKNLRKLKFLEKFIIEKSYIYNFYADMYKEGDVFREFQQLKILSFNSIFSEYTQKIMLNETMFSKLGTVYFLKLQDLKLEELPTGIFHDLARLRFLVLRHNRLTTLDQQVFKNCPELYMLDLSYNKFIRLADSGLLFHLRELTHLELSFNQLTSFTYVNYFNEDLKEILLDHNKIKIETDTCPVITNGLSYGTIDYSFNEISNIEAINDCLARYTDLKLLNVSHNKIQTYQISSNLSYLTSIESSNLHLKSNYPTILDLTNNGLEHINLFESGSIDLFSEQTESFVLQVDCNPVFCSDCKYINRIFGKEHILFASDSFNNPIKIMHPKECDSSPFCPIDRLTEPCPLKCACFYQIYSHTLLIDCENAKLTKIPNLSDGLLLENRTTAIRLNLRNNFINELTFREGTTLQIIALITDINLENNLIENLNINPNHFPISLQNLQLGWNRILTIDSITLYLLNARESLLTVSIGNNSITKNRQLYDEFIDRISFVVTDRAEIDKQLNTLQLESRLRDHQRSQMLTITVMLVVFTLTAIALGYTIYVKMMNRNNDEEYLEEMRDMQSQLFSIDDDCDDDNDGMLI